MISNVKPPTNSYTENVPLRNQAPTNPQTNLPGAVTSIEKGDSAETSKIKKPGEYVCQTCEKRRYQDGSNDPGVSFKSPGYISPESSGSVVMSHEMEHVSNEKSKAQSEKREIVSQNVQVFTSVCPECGKSYVSGGKTTTTTRSAKNSVDAKDPNRGENFDKKI